MNDPRNPQRQDTETSYAHAGRCLGPVYFDLHGGFCWLCGAGPLSPYMWPDAYLRWPPGQPREEETGNVQPRNDQGA